MKMESEPVSKRRRLQPSRKGAKAWRKNIDIKDVEEHMEDTRKDEMIGGPVKEMADQQLFTIDTVGDEKVRKRLSKQKVLKIDQILASRSAIPACGIAGSAKAVNDKTNKTIATSATVKRQLRKVLKTSRLKHAGGKPPSNTEGITKDPWDDSAASTVNASTATFDTHQNLKGEIIIAAAVNNNININNNDDDFISDLMPKPVKAPATLKLVPSTVRAIPAVPAVHPGASYNPQPTDHQELIRQAVEVELEKERREKELASNGPDKAALLRNLQLEPTSTMECDLDDEEDEGDNDNGEYGGHSKSLSVPISKPTKEGRRKTVAQRNREERHRQQLLATRLLQQDRQLEQEIVRVNSLKQELASTDRKLSERQTERQLRRQKRIEMEPPRLSRHAYQPLPVMVQLTEELSGSLRQLRPEGSLLKERLNVLQKRGMVETRLPVSAKRRYQKKEFEKHSYKKFM